MATTEFGNFFSQGIAAMEKEMQTQIDKVVEMGNQTSVSIAQELVKVKADAQGHLREIDVLVNQKLASIEARAEKVTMEKRMAAVESNVSVKMTAQLAAKDAKIADLEKQLQDKTEQLRLHESRLLKLEDKLKAAGKLLEV